MSIGDDLVHEADLALRFGLKLVTLRAWRARRRGPPWISIGRKTYYRREALEVWLRARETDPALHRKTA